MKSKPFVSAVIAAAGNSSRMQSGQNKQLLHLAGMPVIARTIAAFEGSDLVDEIVIVAREQDILGFYDIIKLYQFEKVSQVVRGAHTRQQSVALGIYATDKRAHFFAIHDGARPLVTTALIDRVINDAIKYGAAAAGVKVKDTLKQVGSDGFIVSTPDRTFLWQVQTPQVFESQSYKIALDAAIRDGVELTDDCQLLERIGKRVYMSQGDYSNIKITTLEDLHAAKSMLEPKNDII